MPIARTPQGAGKNHNAPEPGERIPQDAPEPGEKISQAMPWQFITGGEYSKPHVYFFHDSNVSPYSALTCLPAHLPAPALKVRYWATSAFLEAI